MKSLLQLIHDYQDGEPNSSEAILKRMEPLIRKKLFLQNPLYGIRGRFTRTISGTAEIASLSESQLLRRRMRNIYENCGRKSLSLPLSLLSFSTAQGKYI